MSSGDTRSDQHAAGIPSPLTRDSLAISEKDQDHSTSPAGDSGHPSQRDDVSSHVENDSLERIPTSPDLAAEEIPIEPTTTSASAGGPVHSVFSSRQKGFIVFMASWAGFFSPVSGQIYFPALNALATDLHVSNSLINLTLTSYMVGGLVL